MQILMMGRSAHNLPWQSLYWWGKLRCVAVRKHKSLVLEVGMAEASAAAISR